MTHKLCIVQPRIGLTTETFLAAQAERLPAETAVVHHPDGLIPYLGGGPVLSQGVAPRAARMLARRLRGRDWNWEITAAYQEAFRRSGAQVVLAQYGTIGVRLVEACRNMKLPLVVHFHGFDASSREVLERHHTEYQSLFRSAAAIVAVSRAMQQRLIVLGALPNKVRYNPYGIDCRKFQAASAGDNGPTLLAVGRFVEKKAPYLTLLAFHRTWLKHRGARLRMIGDGPLLAPCQNMAAALHLTEAVDFLGPQPHSVVAEEMQRARAVVQHSIEASNGDCEGTPLAVLEAGASGLPVVATRHAGIPDVVIEGETGLLVDERDVDGMAECMIQVVENPAYASALGRAARRRVEQEFEMDQQIAQLWSIIESCIAFATNSRPSRRKRL